MSKNFIPTINISSLIKNNFETQNAFKTIKEIEKACVNVGFFQITGHGINLKEINQLDSIIWYKIEAENFESIHNHNAYAVVIMNRKN